MAMPARRNGTPEPQRVDAEKPGALPGRILHGCNRQNGGENRPDTGCPAHCERQP